MLQMIWESFVNYGIGPLFLAALNYPAQTSVLAIAFCAAAALYVEVRG